MKAVLFDMDGTLVPMDMEVFTKAYFKLLCAKAAGLGHDPKRIMNGMWKGIVAMIENDGRESNSDLFWRVFAADYGESIVRDKYIFDEFYKSEFNATSEACGYNPDAAKTVRRIIAAGCIVALATNPVFPLTAQETRLGWTGLKPDEFAYITAYENSHYCKPNPAYYREILDALGLDARDCLMVGNDTSDDLAAREAGLDVFILTDCLVNSKGVDLSDIPHGDYAALNAYLDKWLM